MKKFPKLLLLLVYEQLPTCLLKFETIVSGECLKMQSKCFTLSYIIVVDKT